MVYAKQLKEPMVAQKLTNGPCIRQAINHLHPKVMIGIKTLDF